MKIRHSFSIVIIAALFLVPVLPGQVSQMNQDKTQKSQAADSEYYEVDVTVQLLPVFAVDKKGDPVFDLKKEEIEFLVDGKPTEIVSFLSSRMEMQEFTRPPAPGAATKKAPTPMRPTERINFIILDTLISNAKIMEINKVIAAAIINKASAGDSYVIFQTNQAQGFRYVIGPEKDKTKLFQALKDIKVPYIRRALRPNIARRKRDYYASLGTHGERDSISTSLYILHAEREQEMYQGDIQRFTQAVKELKYALKTIRLPKTVFLISASTKHAALGISGATQYSLLEDAAKAVNFGGAMLYVVNPIMYKSENKRKALKFMADAAGGKLVHGANIREIVDTVPKSTAAFYELAFYPPAQSGTRSRISMKCKRKGVELISVNYSEKSTPYPKMNDAEKKLFALNVVNGGSWSRITAKVGKIKYKKLNKVTAGNAAHTVEITLPFAM